MHCFQVLAMCLTLTTQHLCSGGASLHFSAGSVLSVTQLPSLRLGSQNPTVLPLLTYPQMLPVLYWNSDVPN
jgi:hypothetical protein